MSSEHFQLLQPKTPCSSIVLYFHCTTDLRVVQNSVGTLNQFLVHSLYSVMYEKMIAELVKKCSQNLRKVSMGRV